MSSEAIAERLCARQGEIEDELLRAIPEALRDPLRGADAEFAAAQRQAIAAALDYALNTFAVGPGSAAPAPASVVEQARRSARQSVNFETVLALYVAERELLGDIVEAEAEEQGIEGARDLQVMLGSLLQQLLPVIARAHQSEADRLRRSPQQRYIARVRRLLAGEQVDAAQLPYEFDAWHTAIIITGVGATRAKSCLEDEGLGQRIFCVEQDDEAVWAWIGGGRPVSSTQIERSAVKSGVPSAVYAIGEPAFGLSGWRLSHRLAQEARRVAIMAPRLVTTYADVGVLAPWALDRERALAFIDIHLGPLSTTRDKGIGARESLREIFRAGHQIGPAASALKVDRGTLRARLTRIERQLGFSLRSRQAELEIALRLETLYGISSRTHITI
jgi:hypothetical protein